MTSDCRTRRLRRVTKSSHEFARLVAAVAERFLLRCAAPAQRKRSFFLHHAAIRHDDLSFHTLNPGRSVRVDLDSHISKFHRITRFRFWDESSLIAIYTRNAAEFVESVFAAGKENPFLCKEPIMPAILAGPTIPLFVDRKSLIRFFGDEKETITA